MGKKKTSLFPRKEDHSSGDRKKKSSTRKKGDVTGEQGTKKYRVSTASRHISSIDLDEDYVDDILKMLLELEMNEKGFSSIDECVANMMGKDGVKEEESRGDEQNDESDGSEEDSSSDESEDSDEEVVCMEDIKLDTVEEVPDVSSASLKETGQPSPSQCNLEDYVISSSFRKFIKKKLIRDDRRLANELKAEQHEAKLKEKMIKKQRYENSQHAPQKSNNINDKNHYNANPLTSQDPKLRIQVCSQKKKTAMKVMTIDLNKGWTVSELVQIIRAKLNEPKKFNALMILPSKKTFNDGDIRLLENDTQLCLYIDDKKTNKDNMTSLNLASKRTKSSKLTNEMSHTVIDEKLVLIDDKCTTTQDDSKEPQDKVLNIDEIVQHDETVIDPTIDVQTPVSNDEEICGLLRQQKNAMIASDSYQKVIEGRQKLPMFKAQQNFLSELQASESRTVIVVGDTGCGKTTQVPQIILDDMIDRNKGSEAYIICTQPRRIATISVAERVSQERLQKCGQMVGYQIRLKSKFSERNTRILFCTTGILLRKMQNKDFLDRVSHIIIDEVHERQVETDFLMAILKCEMSFRHNLRLVLMSATLNSQHLQEYMCQCPVIQVPGRLFPVAIHYIDEVNSLIKSQQKIQSLGGDSRVIKEDLLENSSTVFLNKKKSTKGLKTKSPKDLNPGSIILPHFAADTVAEFIIRLIEKENISAKVGNQEEKGDEPRSSKAILVFLSGLQPITAVMRILRHRQVLDRLKAKVFMLHSSVPAEQQNKVFARLPPPLEWKIVLSTNIAESSVTVDDVVHVVDSGFHREMTFDPVSSVSLLSTVFASKASLTQRCGRAGRVRPGDCWRLFSADFMDCPRLQEYSLPEIKRVPLEDVVLQILILQLGNPREFLSKCMDPPSMEQVDEALQVLLEIGAITSREKSSATDSVNMKQSTINDYMHQPYRYDITPLGRHLANLPVDVRLGKMLIYSSIFGCVEPVLTIVATLSGKSPMVIPPNKKDDAAAAHSRFCSAPRTKHLFFSSTAFQETKSFEDVNTSAIAPSLYSPYSDHLTFVRIYNTFVKIDKTYSTRGRRSPKVYDFCKEHFLSVKVLDDITSLREQFRNYLGRAGFLDDISLSVDLSDRVVPNRLELEECEDASFSLAQQQHINNHFSNSDAILRCVVCAGLFPRVVRVCKVQSHSSAAKSSRNPQYVRKIFDSNGDVVSIHMTSILNKHAGSLLENSTSIYKETEKKKEAFVVYFKKISSPSPSLYDCTEVSPVSLMLFGDSFSELVKSKRSKVIVNKWIHLGISEIDAALVRKLRSEIEQILLIKAKQSYESLESVQQNRPMLQKKQYLVTRILEKILEQGCT